jgi:UDP-N-acetylmuramoyl-tripeptide--D-alanyl-D-alanine ligase
VLRIRKPLIIGITGSVGKTTTKELLAQLLTRPEVGRQLGLVWKTSDNMNDNVGVPLSILGSSYFPTISLKGLGYFLRLPFRAMALATLAQYPRILVLEFGAGTAGEISYNASRAVPHIAVVTAVGPAHLEAFGSVAGVARAKAALVDHVPSDGLVVLGDDNPHLEEFTTRSAAEVVVVGARCEDLAPAIVRIIAAHLEIPSDSVEAAIHEFRALPGRFQVQQIGELLLVDDAFNANPLSMRCALARLSGLGSDGRRRVAILGGMAELGEEEERYHREIAPLAGVSSDLLVGVGNLARKYGAHRWFPTSEACAATISEIVQPHDIVLVKGSHSVGLAAVNRAIRDWAEGESAPPR